jgi:hypothetical protein
MLPGYNTNILFLTPFKYQRFEDLVFAGNGMHMTYYTPGRS